MLILRGDIARRRSIGSVRRWLAGTVLGLAGGFSYWRGARTDGLPGENRPSGCKHSADQKSRRARRISKLSTLSKYKAVEMQSTARVTSVLALAAAARPEACAIARQSCSCRGAMEGRRPRAAKSGESSRRGPLSFWPPASRRRTWRSTRASRPWRSCRRSAKRQRQKGSGKAAVPVGDSSLPDFGRAAPKETAPEIAAAGSAHEEGRRATSASR